ARVTPPNSSCVPPGRPRGRMWGRRSKPGATCCACSRGCRRHPTPCHSPIDGRRVTEATPPIATADAEHAEGRVIDTREEYRGEGPFAVDAERASGFRYSQRAYLIQVFRRGSGAFLFDPPAIGDFHELAEVMADEEWILHAASQDLACLREVGLDPARIFDTELGARLAGLPRVGLATVVEELL